MLAKWSEGWVIDKFINLNQLILEFKYLTKQEQCSRQKVVLFFYLQICGLTISIRFNHRIQIERASLSKKMLGLAWDLFLYFVN